MAIVQSVGVILALWITPIAFAVILSVVVRLAARTGALDPQADRDATRS